MTDVFTRHKDIQYSGRIETQIKRQQQIHRLRHVINELEARLPEATRSDPAVRELTSYGCQSRMHVVQLLAPSWIVRPTRKTSTSARPASRRAGRQVTLTRLPSSPALPGEASSTLSPASYFTKHKTPLAENVRRAVSEPGLLNTDKLIDALAEDASPQRSVSRVLLLAAISCALVAGATSFLFVGFRPDITEAVESLRFLFKFVVTIILAVAATGAALHLARP
jgi:hypothetical protein